MLVVDLLFNNNNFQLKEKLEAAGLKRCSRCKQDIKLEEFAEHLETCEVNNKPTCQICGKTFFRSSLNQHMKTCGKPPEELRNKNCPVCGKACSDLKKHMRVHNQEAKECPECGKMVRHLEKHLITMHTPDSQKRAVCSECGKGFDDKNKLGIHMMNVHLKLRPYRCRYGCDIGYNDKSNRNCHEKKKHGGIFKG